MQEDTGTYIFHVGPVSDLEIEAAWDTPGVFTLTALNHGPDGAPAARVEVMLPPGLRPARSEAGQGSYANGVWDIGELETAERRRAQGLPEGATLTIFTEPVANVGTPNEVVTASIENAEDYCVRIKTSAPSSGNDLECTGILPSGYTEHSAAYYDHRPKNNKVALPADWTAAQSVAATRLTGLAFTSEGGYQPGDDIEVTATFNNDVTVSGQPRLRLRVGEITREAALHSHSYDTVVFRYRVREGDSDAVDGVSIPPSPFVLPPGAGISVPGSGRVSLFFAGLPDQSAHRVYPNIDRVEGSNALVWSPPEELYTGVDGARYRLFDRMRHYYRWNETTRRWEVEFRIADAGLDAPDQNLIQWLVLRASGYHIGRPHAYGAAPVEMVPYLGGWDTRSQWQQQVCAGLKAEFPPGRTRGQRLEELKGVGIHRFAYKPYGDGEYEVHHREYVAQSLGTARGIAAEAPCPDPPTGTMTIYGRGSTRGAFGVVLDDPNGVVEGSESWQWKRSPEGTNSENVDWTGFQNIPGANGQSYIPGPEDAGRYLRVKASYIDGQRSTRVAWGQTEGPVPDQVQVQGAPQQQQQAPPTPAGQTVPADSPLVPEGMGPGDRFRLLFVTSTTTTAESADIADYNAFVQARAAANSNLAGFSGQFRALISTASVNIKDNTATTGTGVPVHWLGGDKAADDYADLYDLSWDSVSGLTETGSSYTGLVWTGGNGYGETSLRRYAGAAEVRMGDLSDDTRALSSPTHKAATEAYPLYALSPVLTVAQPEPEQPGQQQKATNNQPQFAAGSASRNVDENAAAGTSVGQPIIATDPDGDPLTYTLSGSGAFAIDQSIGQISVATGAALDHETQDSYSLTVTVSDGKNASGEADASADDSMTVNVSVVNVDEKGKVSVDLDPPRSSSPLRASLLDPDGVAGGSVKWQWKRSPDGTTAQNVDATDFSDIPGATGASYTPVEGDVGRWLRVLAIYTDPFGSGKRARAQTANPVERKQAPPPTVTGVAVVSDPGDDDTYVLDDVIRIRVTFSEAVNVSGNPRLKIDMDPADWGEKWAAYEGGSGTNSLTFTHTVVEPNFSSLGIAVLADSLELNGGGIVSASTSVSADLSHSGLGHDPNHKVDWQG